MLPIPVQNRWCRQFILLCSVVLCSFADWQRSPYGVQGNTYFVMPVKTHDTTRVATNLELSGATRLPVRQFTITSIISFMGLGDVTISVPGTDFDSRSLVRPRKQYESSTSKKPQAVFTSQRQQISPSSQDIDYPEPQTAVNPSEKGFTNSQQSFPTTFITPSQNGFSGPQSIFSNPLQNGYSPNFTPVMQSGFINPNEGSFTNPSQSGFLTSVVTSKQPVTSKPPIPVFYSQSQTLSNNQKPVFSKVPVPQFSNQLPSNCMESDSTVNGRPVCKQQQIFLDKFGYFNSTVWSYDMEFSSLPDSEFCVFTGLADNSWTNGGTLQIVPTLTDEKYGKNFVFSGQLDLPDCTASNADRCSQQGEFAYILPPTMSARYSTRRKWHFKYGKVDIIAKLPRGDWLYPEIWLVSAESNSQTKYRNRLEMATARGNVHLRSSEGNDIGASLLEVGASASSSSNRGFMEESFELREPGNRLWSDDFHTYSLLWTKDAIAFSVDGSEIGVLRPSSRVPSFTFQKEMYLVIGLGVGGVRVFPDTTGKPWTNTEPKAVFKFWKAKKQWYKTWRQESSKMTIREIRITSL